MFPALQGQLYQSQKQLLECQDSAWRLLWPWITWEYPSLCYPELLSAFPPSWQLLPLNNP